MEPAVVESGRLYLAREGAVELAVRRRRALNRKEGVPPCPAHEERPAVQIELLAADLQLAHAEALVPRLHYPPPLHEIHARRVEVRMRGRPGPEGSEREFQDEG